MSKSTDKKQEILNSLHIFRDDGESIKWDTIEIPDDFQTGIWIEPDTNKKYIITNKAIERFEPETLSKEWIKEKAPKLLKKVRFPCVKRNLSINFTTTGKTESVIYPDTINVYPESDIDANMVREIAQSVLLKKGMYASFKAKVGTTVSKKLIIIGIIVAILIIGAVIMITGQPATTLPPPIVNATGTPTVNPSVIIR